MAYETRSHILGPTTFLRVISSSSKKLSMYFFSENGSAIGRVSDLLPKQCSSSVPWPVAAFSDGWATNSEEFRL